MASQNNEDENITVSTVYETLRSRRFLNDLYWDVVSSIKDKSTFKHMREVTDKIIKKKIDMIETKPDLSDKAKKGIIAEICSMTYAIDAVFSKILYMKLDKCFKETVNEIVEDLTEGKHSKNILSKIVSSNSTECSNSISTKGIPEQNEKEKEPQHKKRKQSDISCSNSELGHQTDITEKKVNYATKKLSKKDIEDSIKASKTVTKKTGTSPLASTPRKMLVDKEAPTVSKNTAVTFKPDDEDEISDAESEISVGHLSIASVSSVHTSDLSSFDDEISIGSEDEGGSKKRLSLKYLQQLCENGLPKLEKITSIKQKEPANAVKPKEPANAVKPKEAANAVKPKEPANAVKPKEPANAVKPNLPTNVIKSKEPTNGIKPKEPQKEIKVSAPRTTKAKTKNQVSPVKVSPNTPDSTSSESSTSVTSKRIRKPNSKYSSANIVCQSVKVKERKKQPDVSPKKTNEKDSSNGNASKETKRLRSESSEIGMSNKMQKIDFVEKEKYEKSALKENETSGLCKLQFPMRSLTSRKSAPLTLFSTS